MILPPNGSKSELLVGYKIIKMGVKIMYGKTDMGKNFDKLTNSVALDTDKVQLLDSDELTEVTGGLQQIPEKSWAKTMPPEEIYDGPDGKKHGDSEK